MIKTDKKQEVIKLIHQEELLNTINTAEKSELINRYNYSFSVDEFLSSFLSLRWHLQSKY